MGALGLPRHCDTCHRTSSCAHFRETLFWFTREEAAVRGVLSGPLSGLHNPAWSPCCAPMEHGPPLPMHGGLKGHKDPHVLLQFLHGLGGTSLSVSTLLTPRDLSGLGASGQKTSTGEQ